MCVNNHPYTIDTPEEEGLKAAIVYLPLIALHCCFDFDIGNCPSEFAFDVRFDIQKISTLDYPVRHPRARHDVRLSL
jgi:hypothetical protein